MSHLVVNLLFSLYVFASFLGELYICHTGLFPVHLTHFI